jgi:hypothetical protein
MGALKKAENAWKQPQEEMQPTPQFYPSKTFTRFLTYKSVRHKSVLFEDVQFVIICYSNNRKLIELENLFGGSKLQEM